MHYIANEFLPDVKHNCSIPKIWQPSRHKILTLPFALSPSILLLNRQWPPRRRHLTRIIALIHIKATTFRHSLRVHETRERQRGWVFVGRRAHERRDAGLHGAHLRWGGRASGRRRFELEVLLLVGDETALDGEILGLMAFALDVLFFFDADAVFFFLEVGECGAGVFVDGFLKDGVVGALYGVARAFGGDGACGAAGG
jgi:hypothetical protein